MKTSDKGRQFIEGFEGCILSAYDDRDDRIVHSGDTIRGVLTIGYGHTTAAGSPRVYVGQTISKEMADQILGADLTSVEIEVQHLVRVYLNQNQFDALVSFQFNTGALGRSTLLTKLNNGDYEGAAEEFLKWNKAGGKILDGLVRRRQAERELFLTPIEIPDDPVNTSVFTTIKNLTLRLITKGD